MNSNQRDRGNETRVELKYCEHCGGLWIREGGAGVYCGKCQPKIEDLPIPRRQRRPKLPVCPRTVVERYDAVIDGELTGDLEATGGVA